MSKDQPVSKKQRPKKMHMPVDLDIWKQAQDIEQILSDWSKTLALGMKNNVGAKRLTSGIRLRIKRDAALAKTLYNIASLCLCSLLELSESPNDNAYPSCGEYLTKALTNALVSFTEICQRPDKRDEYQSLARANFVFPSLVSIFAKCNSEYERFVRDDLQLGQRSPFSIDPRRTNNRFNRLAMEVVLHIDRHRGGRREGALYEKVVPGFAGKAFCKENIAAWEKVAAFHLDFFCGPEKRRRAAAFEFDLDDDDGGPLGLEGAKMDIVRTFRNLLEDGADRNVRTELTLFNRVKHKVLGILREIAPSTPSS